MDRRVGAECARPNPDDPRHSRVPPKRGAGWPYRPRGFPIANGPGPVIGRGVQPDPNGPGVRASGAREPANPSAEIAVAPKRRTARCGPTEAQTGLAPARGVREAPSKYPRVGRRRFPIQSDRRRRWPYRSLTKVGEMECGVRSVRGTSWPYDAIRWAMWKEAGNRQWPYCPTRWAY